MLFVSWSQRFNPRLCRIMLLSWKLLSNWVTNIQQQFHWIHPSLWHAFPAILQARCSMIFWSDTFIRISLKLPPEGRFFQDAAAAGSWNERQPARKLHNMHGHISLTYLCICHEIFYISNNIQGFDPTYKKYQNMGMIRTLPCSSVLRLGRSMTQRMPSSWWGKLSARPPPKQIKNTSSFIIMCWQCNYITLQGTNISHLGKWKIIDSKVH